MPKRAKPGIVKVFKTAVFKVHNPSQHKRAMMDYALRQGEHAFWKAIDHVAPKVPALLPMKKNWQRLFRAKSLASWIAIWNSWTASMDPNGRSERPTIRRTLRLGFCCSRTRQQRRMKTRPET